jgi:hypothetical protein
MAVAAKSMSGNFAALPADSAATAASYSLVMAPAIHRSTAQDFEMDGRVKPGHDMGISATDIHSPANRRRKVLIRPTMALRNPEVPSFNVKGALTLPG